MMMLVAVLACAVAGAQAARPRNSRSEDVETKTNVSMPCKQALQVTLLFDKKGSSQQAQIFEDWCCGEPLLVLEQSLGMQKWFNAIYGDCEEQVIREGTAANEELYSKIPKDVVDLSKQSTKTIWYSKGGLSPTRLITKAAPFRGDSRGGRPELRGVAGLRFELVYALNGQEFDAESETCRQELVKNLDPRLREAAANSHRAAGGTWPSSWCERLQIVKGYKSSRKV